MRRDAQQRHPPPGCFDDKVPAEQSGIMAMHFFFDRTEKILFQGAGNKNWIQVRGIHDDTQRTTHVMH